MAVGSSTPSPPSLGDRRFIVVDREEEEEAKEMISLRKKQGKTGEGEGFILTRHGTVRSLCPPPTTPLLPVCTCHSIAHQAPFWVQNHPKPHIAFQLREEEEVQGQ
jgi:hypothetical protein